MEFKGVDLHDFHVCAPVLCIFFCFRYGDPGDLQENSVATVELVKRLQRLRHGET